MQMILNRKEPRMDQKILDLAGLILNCQPQDLRGSSLRADGSLAVIAPNGMKFIFSPVELENARDSFGLPPITDPHQTVSPVQPIAPIRTQRHRHPDAHPKVAQ
jgi:hypothetical protein